MYYDKDLQVTLTDENGKTRRLATFPDADGHMIIAGESGAAGTVVICSYNKIVRFCTDMGKLSFWCCCLSCCPTQG